MPTATQPKRRRRYKKRRSKAVTTRAKSRNLTPIEQAPPRFRLLLQSYKPPSERGKKGGFYPVKGQSLLFHLPDLEAAIALFSSVEMHLKLTFQKS